MFQTLRHGLQACPWLCVSPASPLVSTCFPLCTLDLPILSFLKDPHAAGLYRTPGNSVVGIVHSSLFSTSCIQHGTLGEMSFTTSLRFISLASHFKNLLEAELYLLVWCYSCCQTERSLR